MTGLTKEMHTHLKRFVSVATNDSAFSSSPARSALVSAVVLISIKPEKVERNNILQSPNLNRLISDSWLKRQPAGIFARIRSYLPQFCHFSNYFVPKSWKMQIWPNIKNQLFIRRRLSHQSSNAALLQRIQRKELS